MPPLKLFICAASQDQALCEELAMHLAPMEHQELIELVDDQDLALGQEADAQRIERIGQAAIVLLMLSPALLRGLRRNVMIQEALKRYVSRQLVLIPVILRPTDWQVYSFGNLVALPRDGRSVTERGTSPASRDPVWVSIVRELRQVIEKQQAAQQAGDTPVDGAAAGDAAAPGPTAKGGGGNRRQFLRGHALIIGTGGTGIEVTERDAQGLHELLVDETRAGYPASQARLLVGSHATRDAILKELEKLAERVNQDPDQNATALVYFSGHGLRLEGTTPTYYLLPHGHVDGQEATTAVSGKEFSDRISAIKARKIMVFLDCCHAAGMPKGNGRGPAAIPADLERQLGMGSGVVIVASSRDDEKSYTGTPYSVFTACLLEALQGRGSTDGYARVLNVLGYLMQEVPRREPKQHPMIKKLLDLGDNFPICFYGQGDATPPPAPPQSKGRLSQEQRRPLEGLMSGLRETSERYIKKLTMLRNARATTADPMQQFQLDQNIVDAEKEFAEIEEKIDSLSARLGP